MGTNTLSTGQVVYDPRGIIDSQQKPIAGRAGSLGGLRLGVLDNTKWNAGKLLRGVADSLNAEAGFADVRYYKKESFSKDAAPELIARIASENDLALVAIGD